jgi:PAS domain S-box-containing protein
VRLAEFIRQSMEEIIQNWMNFALSIPLLRELHEDDREDHARELLLSISEDLDREQSDREKHRKSLGRQTFAEVFSEFRALRAAVLRLWSSTLEENLPVILDDLNRFNEAIDQALSQSLMTYVVEQNKKINLLDQVLSSIPDHACVMDTNGRLLYANYALSQYFKKRTQQLIGKSLAELGVASAQRFDSEIQQVIKARAVIHSEIFTELDSGQRIFHEYVLASVFNKKGEVEAVTATARDITERKLYDAVIWRKANFDALTDLPNRHLFRDRLNHEVRHAERTGSTIALLFIDLDRFKEVNDALGHSAGDRLLQLAAQRIRVCIRAEDTVARLGGDEFTVILTGIHQPENVQQIAQKIVS